MLMSKIISFNLQNKFIELNKLLKVLSLVETGGQANKLISEGLVQYNGKIETRKRLKVKKGDNIVFGNVIISVL